MHKIKVHVECSVQDSNVNICFFPVACGCGRSPDATRNAGRKHRVVRFATSGTSSAARHRVRSWTWWCPDIGSEDVTSRTIPWSRLRSGTLRGWVFTQGKKLWRGWMTLEFCRSTLSVVEISVGDTFQKHNFIFFFFPLSLHYEIHFSAGKTDSQ